jgi:ferredoxin
VRPEIDESLCIGDGICVDICPQVFEMGDDNLAHVIDESPDAALEYQVREAADACPTSAITVHED